MSSATVIDERPSTGWSIVSDQQPSFSRWGDMASFSVAESAGANHGVHECSSSGGSKQKIA